MSVAVFRKSVCKAAAPVSVSSVCSPSTLGSRGSTLNARPFGGEHDSRAHGSDKRDEISVEKGPCISSIAAQTRFLGRRTPLASNFVPPIRWNFRGPAERSVDRPSGSDSLRLPAFPRRGEFAQVSRTQLPRGNNFAEMRPSRPFLVSSRDRPRRTIGGKIGESRDLGA